jgi:hypothetical protein
MDGPLKKYTLLILKALVGIASGCYIVFFLYISLSRLFFPIALDWVEGPVLVQVKRVLLGQPLYVQPGAAYIPLVYQPLYFYLAAAFTRLLGFGLAPLRLLSILASCGCCLLIFLITHKATGSGFPGLIVSGMFAATNGIVWAWFDFARVDMLSIFLALLGLYFLMWTDLRGTLLAGLFFTLSFFTKQSAIIIIFPAFIFYFLINRKLTLILVATTGLLTFTGILLLNYASNGWYYFYIFTLPSLHRSDISSGQIIYIVTSMLEPVLLLLGIAIISILTGWRKIIQEKHYYFFFGLAACVLALSIVSALGVGATRNAFIPAYALIAIMCGLSLQISQEKIATLLSGNLRFVCSMLLIVVCLWQFSLLQYKARDYIPSERDFKRAYALIKELKNTEGEFLISPQNYLALYVDKKVYYHEAALGEFTGRYGHSLPEWPSIQKEIKTVIQSGEVSTVYLADFYGSWAGVLCKQETVLRSQSKFVPTLYKMICR